MSARLIVKNFAAVGGVSPYTFVKAGPAESQVAVADASVALGVSTEVGAIDGQRLDVTLLGEEFLTAGAAFPAFSELVPDGSGHAVAAAPASGHVVKTAALALEAAEAAGDQVRVIVRPGCAVGA